MDFRVQDSTKSFDCSDFHYLFAPVLNIGSSLAFELALFKFIAMRRRRRSRFRFTSIPTVPARLSTNSQPSRVSSQQSTPELTEVRETSGTQMNENCEMLANCARNKNTIDRSAQPLLEVEHSNTHIALQLTTPSSPLNPDQNGATITSIPQELLQTSLHIDNNAEAMLNGVSEVSKFGNEITTWAVLWALIMNCGSLRFTKEQYLSFRSCAQQLISDRSFSSDPTGESTTHSTKKRKLQCAFPHYETLRREYVPIVFNCLTVRLIQVLAKVSLRKYGSSTSTSEDRTVPVSYVLPSEYVRADVRTPQFLERWKQSANPCANSIFMSPWEVDNIPLVKAKELFYGLPRRISVDRALSHSLELYAEVGDVISIELLSAMDMNPRLIHQFRLSITASSLRIDGQIIAIIPVLHDSILDINEINTTNCSDRDRQLIQILSYTPTEGFLTVSIDGVTVCNQVDQDTDVVHVASDNMRPLLKPGDTVALIRPASSHASISGLPATEVAINTSETYSSDRICFVHRFWLNDAERSRFCTWVPGDISIPSRLNSNRHVLFKAISNNPTSYHVDVSQCTLTNPHTNLRGADKYSTTRSSGVLPSGQPYLIYRAVLFWDGFEMFTGKHASGDGVYMSCFNIAAQYCNDPSSVRILSLTPPGVKAEFVLSEVMDDIALMSTEGIEVYDAHGTLTRVFFDLVALLGDTPGLNASLDVMGHTASVCCHLCRYHRHSRYPKGPKFCFPNEHGGKTAFARTVWKHRAIRKTNPPDLSLKKLGMGTRPNEMQRPLYNLQHKRQICVSSLGSSTNMHITRNLSNIDPLRASLVAPDHLLCGHFKNCLEFAFKTLPTKESRLLCEKLILRLLAHLLLPTQTRILDIDKCTLYTMSMTEMYSVAVVAGTGLQMGIKLYNKRNSLSSFTLEKINNTTHLVLSFSAVIAKLWDCTRCSQIRTTNESNRETNGTFAFVQSMQRMVDAHINIVSDLCNSNNTGTESNRRRPSSESGRRHSELFTETAIRHLDKPNIHRLRELVYCTLPAVPYVAWYSELVFEKTHQRLKRGIRQSNMKDAHIQAMRSVVFDDWQGRITMAVQLADSQKVSATRSIKHLLSRPNETNPHLDGETTKMTPMLNALFDKSHCLRRELDKQAKSVLREKSTMDHDSHWTLCSPCDASVPWVQEVLSKVTHLIEMVHDIISNNSAAGEVLFAETAEDARKNNGRKAKICVGHVIEAFVPEGLTVDDHYPSVVTFEEYENGTTAIFHYKRSFWLVTALFKPRISNTIYAIVLPCVIEGNATDCYLPVGNIPDDSSLTTIQLQSSTTSIPFIRHHSTIGNGTSWGDTTLDYIFRFEGIPNFPFTLFTSPSGYPPRRG
eukprot:IDg23015t1